MVDQQIFRDKSQEIIEAGRFLYSKGWVPATSGNFSARLSETAFAVTASGKHKGDLTPGDILIADMSGNVADGRTPSAETLLHTAIYKCTENTGAILHTHSVKATVLTRACRAGEDLIFEGYEMQKAFSGNTTHDAAEMVPIFANTQDMKALSADVEETLLKRPHLHGFLIQGHGLYTWGNDMSHTRRHIEAFEFLFDCELEARRIR